MQRTVDGFLLLFLLVLLVAVSACSANFPELGTADVLDTEPSIEATAEPTEAPKIPESFSSQAEILEANGYSVTSNEIGEWVVVEQRSGTEVVRASGEGYIVYQTKDGEIEVPEESFVARQVAGVGVSLILTIENQAGVSDFYLNRTGIDGAEYHYWTSPIEIQKNPEIIENYTQIELEDVWSGRLLYSELLNAEPFTEATLVPDYFVYELHRFPKGFLIEINGYFSDSEYADRAPGYVEFLNENNDWRRWVAFYRSVTPSGEDVIIGTQQAMAQDGRSSLFFHYVFGPEWPRERDYYNLIDHVFLSITHENAGGDFGGALYSPAIYWEGLTEEGHRTFFSHFGGALDNRMTAAGIELYELPENTPVKLTGWTEDEFAKWRSFEELKFGGNLTPVGSELGSLQFFALLTHSTAGIPENYYGPR